MIEVLELENYKIKVVYKICEEIIGYVVVEDVTEVINVIDVYVEENHRRQGIATFLFDYIFDMFKNRKVRYILEVRKDNVPAINLYSKLGFKRIYVRQKYYKDVDAIIMEVLK